MQDGKTLPNGPIVISPDGLFPSLYREGEIFFFFPSLRNYLMSVTQMVSPSSFLCKSKMEGEVMDSRPTRFACNIPIKKKKVICM